MHAAGLLGQRFFFSFVFFFLIQNGGRRFTLGWLECLRWRTFTRLILILIRSLYSYIFNFAFFWGQRYLARLVKPQNCPKMLRNLTFVVLLYQTKERKRVTIFVLFFLFFWRNVWATFVTKSNLWLSLSNVWATFWGISGNFLWISSNLQKALPRPHCAGEIWKLSFISMVRPTAHTNPSRKRNFSKTLFRSEVFENGGFAF